MSREPTATTEPRLAGEEHCLYRTVLGADHVGPDDWRPTHMAALYLAQKENTLS